MQHRVDRLIMKRGISEKQALEVIKEMDESRETYIQKYDDTSRYDTRNYQLVLSMDNMTPEAAVEVIMAYISQMNG